MKEFRTIRLCSDGTLWLSNWYPCHHLDFVANYIEICIMSNAVFIGLWDVETR